MTRSQDTVITISRPQPRRPQRRRVAKTPEAVISALGRMGILPMAVVASPLRPAGGIVGTYRLI